MLTKVDGVAVGVAVAVGDGEGVTVGEIVGVGVGVAVPAGVGVGVAPGKFGLCNTVPSKPEIQTFREGVAKILLTEYWLGNADVFHVTPASFV